MPRKKKSRKNLSRQRKHKPKKKRKKLSKDQKDMMEVLGEILVLILMIKPIFNLSVFTGIGYLIAIGGSIYHGTILKKKDFARYLFGGTIICYAAGTLLPNIITQFKSGEWLSFGLMSILAVYIWLKGYFLKKGKQI